MSEQLMGGSSTSNNRYDGGNKGSIELIAGRGRKLVTPIQIPTIVVRPLTPRCNPLLHGHNQYTDAV